VTAASRPRVVRLHSGDLVRIRQVQPDDAAALARAYAKLSEESRYRRFFTAMPELSDSLLHAAAEVDHENHEALVALPLLSGEIVGECRFVRLDDRPDTANLAVTVTDAWQRRGLASALLARLSARALEVGITYFTAEILAENRTVLGLLPRLGDVQTEGSGTVVEAQVEIAEPPEPGPIVAGPADLVNLLAAAARGEIIGLPAPFRRLARVPEAVVRIVLLPVIAVRRALLADEADDEEPDVEGPDEAAPADPGDPRDPPLS